MTRGGEVHKSENYADVLYGSPLNKILTFRGDYECEASEHEVVDKESGWVTKVAKKRVVGDSSRSDRRSQRGGTSARHSLSLLQALPLTVTVVPSYQSDIFSVLDLTNYSYRWRCAFEDGIFYFFNRDLFC